MIGSPCAKCGGQGRVAQHDREDRRDTRGRGHRHADSHSRRGRRGPAAAVRAAISTSSPTSASTITSSAGATISGARFRSAFRSRRLAGPIEVRTIDGTEKLDVAPGTQPGEVYTLRGKGMPDPSGRARGDLNVVIKVETPTTSTTSRRPSAAVRRVAEARRSRETRTRSFFERVKDAFSGL